VLLTQTSLTGYAEESISQSAMKFLGTTAILALLAFQPYANAEDDGGSRSFLLCSGETNHAKLYEFGKKLADGWSYWIKHSSKEEAKHPVRTRESFMNRGLIGIMDKYSLKYEGETSILTKCYMGYNHTAKDAPWSSVHKGLIDYLPPKQKTKFMSLPER